MSDVPYMKLFWSDFFGDPKVQALDPETRGMYLQLLGRMWMNGGWVANDDRIIARLLGVSSLRWKRHYRPKLETLIFSRNFPQIVGGILTQKRIEREWQITAKTMAENKVKMAKVRAEKIARSKQRSFSSEPDDAPMAKPVDNGEAAPVAKAMHNEAEGLPTEGIPEPDKKGPGERPINQAGDARPSADAGALRSRTPLIDAIKAKRIAEGRVPGTTTIAGSSLFERLNAAKGGD